MEIIELLFYACGLVAAISLARYVRILEIKIKMLTEALNELKAQRNESRTK